MPLRGDSDDLAPSESSMTSCVVMVVNSAGERLVFNTKKTDWEESYRDACVGARWFGVFKLSELSERSSTGPMCHCGIQVAAYFSSESTASGWTARTVRTHVRRLSGPSAHRPGPNGAGRRVGMVSKANKIIKHTLFLGLSCRLIYRRR